MSEFQVEGMALKKLIKLAKKNPLPFGFNPSPKIPECYLAMHRKKPAKIIGKDAKDEGVSEKSAFGTIKVEGKLLVLNCERLVPNLAKTLKKYLKLQKVMLNVEVRDAGGNVLEADVEDGLPDDPELEGDDEEDGFDKAALSKRLGELRKRIQALDPEAAKKFSPPYAKVVAMFKAEDFEKCVKGADQIEAALPKPSGKAAPDASLAKLAEHYKKLVVQAKNIEDTTKRGNIEKALGQAAQLLKAQKATESEGLLRKITEAIKKALAATVPDAPAPPDPQAVKLSQLLRNYRDQLPRVLDEKTQKAIGASIAQVAEMLKSGDLANATKALPKIRDALKNAVQASAKKTEQPLPDGPVDTPLSGQEAKEFAEWTKIHKELSDKVDNALTKGLVADVDDLRKNWNWAVNNAADKKYDEALKPIPKVRTALAAGTEDGKSIFTETIPSDVKPFAESRVRWSYARSKMHSEMDKVKDSIIAAVSDDPELSQQVKANVGVLTRNLEKLDERLEDKLDEIVNESASESRDKLKIQARSLIDEYYKELETDFFQDIDSNSGFGNVAVLATAQKALTAIENVLN